VEERGSDGSETHAGADADRRFDELTEKRDREGLSREEADELGRMYAEREGKPYANADHPTPEVEEERHSGGDDPAT
jgi:hypothetical protein